MAKAGAPDAGLAQGGRGVGTGRAGPARAGDGSRTRRGRTTVARAVRVRGREELRGHAHRLDATAQVLGVEGKVGKGPAVRLVTSSQFPLGSGTRASRAGRGRGAWRGCSGGGSRCAGRPRRTNPEVVDRWKVTDVDGRWRRQRTGGRAGRGTGYVVDGDAGPVAGPAVPWAALLPGLDPTAMGWRERTGISRRSCGRCCSTAAGMWVRRCGGTGGWWAVGPSGATGDRVAGARPRRGGP